MEETEMSGGAKCGNRMRKMEKVRALRRYQGILPFLGLALLSFFFCWLFVGRYGIFGAKVDWISQHSVIPDYFRQQFYDTGELFPEFGANIGGGQNIYHFSYYGLFSPVVLFSYLFPFVKMGDYLMAASVISLTAAVLLFCGWLMKRGFSGKISFMVSLMYLLSGPMIFHSYSQIMFVNYMPFLCMAFLGVDRYFDRGKKLLYTISVFLMIMTSFYFSIGGMLALVLYGIYRYLECKREWKAENADKLRENRIACDVKTGKGDLRISKINIVCDSILCFIRDGIRFLCPMMVSVLMSGILLLPTAAALAGREGAKREISLVSLLIPGVKVDCMLYDPYGIGLTALFVTVLIVGSAYRSAHERVLSWGCTAVLTIPFFTWALNGGLYIREKALIPFLPLLCYLIACYVKKQEEERISFIQGMLPFLVTIGILLAGQRLSGASGYGKFFLIDGVITAGCYLLFYRKKESLFLLVPPVVFLILFGSMFHKQADRIENREFYEKATDPAIGQMIGEVLEQEEGFCRLEQVGSGKENEADLNRIWNMRQYISSIYSSAYHKEYQDFRKDVFGVEEPFRNDLMQSVSRNPVFLKLMGVRYLISEEEIPGYEEVAEAVENEAAKHEAAAEAMENEAAAEAVENEAAKHEAAGGLSVYENRQTAPIAYVTDQMVSEKAYDELEFPYNQMALVYGAVKPGKAAAAAEKRILKEAGQALVPVEMEVPEQESESLRIAKAGTGYRVQAQKKGSILLELPAAGNTGAGDGDRILFLQFDVKNRESGQDVSVWLEGEKNKLSAGNHIYYNGNTTFSFAVVLEKGKNFAELTLGKGDYELTDLNCFLGDWGEQAQQERSGRLYQAAFHPDWEKTQGNVISGTVDAERDGYFVTSIPYEQNFEIRVDGKAVKYEKVNTAFLGFPVQEGSHHIEMVYHAPGRKAGVWCSAAGAVLLLGCCLGRLLFTAGRRQQVRM